MKESTPYELIMGFPHSSLPKVTGEVMFDDLNIIQCILNNNAMSVSSYEGGGLHGHLGIVMTNDEYFFVATDVFPAPVNPCTTYSIIVGAMAVHIIETNRARLESMRVYRTYHNVDQAFKKLIIDSF
jgi:hypothetical protein